MYERMWRIDQVCAFKSILATGTHEWWLARSVTRAKHAESWRVNTSGSL